MTAHHFSPYYMPPVYIPALVVLLVVALYCQRHYPDVWRRIRVGFRMGAISTLALDAARHAQLASGGSSGHVRENSNRKQGFRSVLPCWPLCALSQRRKFWTFLRFCMGEARNPESHHYLGSGVADGGRAWNDDPSAHGGYGLTFQCEPCLATIFYDRFGVALRFLAHHFLTDAERGGLLESLRGGKTFHG